MTEKELREIKRRFRPDRSNVPSIVGCFVNTEKQIITRIDQSLALGDSIVSEKLLSVMKRTLSGSLGTNLNTMSFTTKQVTDAPQHKLLMGLLNSHLMDKDLLEEFYSAVIGSLSFESNYVILLANDVYDVPTYSKNDEECESTRVFSYLICAICPIKSIPEQLTLRESDSLFHAISSSALLCPPELGFMFPCFDDRMTNIYSSLYYTRSIAKSYSDFTSAVLLNDSPMPPKVQKESFDSVLSEALGEDVVRSMHAQFAEMVTQHKESRDPEPLTVTRATVKSVLENCGVSEEKLVKMEEKFDESFGKNAELSPKNIVSSGKFEMKMPEVTVKISPEYRNLVSTQVIGEDKYLMIKVTGGVEVNGIILGDEDQ